MQKEQLIMSLTGMGSKVVNQKKNQTINDDIQASGQAKQSPFDPEQYQIPKWNKLNQNRLRQREKERIRAKSEFWYYPEIKKIFNLYTQFGSKWKVIESHFSDRSANSIKNRFYTVIRTFLKLLFRYHPYIKQKLPHQIASKLILKFYEARQQFQKFQDFGKKTLKLIDYNLDSEDLKELVLQNLQAIQEIYYLIFQIKPKQQQEEEKNEGREQGEQENQQNVRLGKKSKSQGNCSIQKIKIQENDSNRVNAKSSPIDIHKSKTDIDAQSQNNMSINQNQNLSTGLMPNMNNMNNSGGYVYVFPIPSYPYYPTVNNPYGAFFVYQ